MSSELSLLCKGLSGLFWAATYLLILRRSFQDKVFGMPLIAFCANISWEFVYAFIAPPSSYTFPPIVHVIWFGLDIIIGFQVMTYGRIEFKNLSSPLYYLGVIGILIYSFVGNYLIYEYFSNSHDSPAITYSGLLIIFFEAALFIAMLLRRNNMTGQSIYIGLFKLIGTQFAIVTAVKPEINAYFLYYTWIGVSIMDIVYVVLLYNTCKKLNMNPWKHC